MTDTLKASALALCIVIVSIQENAMGLENVLVPQGCQLAERPAIPDGETISEAQLIQTKTNLQQYLTEADVFLRCLKRYEESLGEDIDGDKRVVIITSHNKVVDEMYLAGDEFNVALRKFNRRASP